MAIRFEDLAYRLGQRSQDPARLSSPLRGGRRIDFPKGDHRRPPAFFSFCELGQGLWDSQISATLSVFCVFWSHALNVSIFPKTAVGPSASEKPCGLMLSFFYFSENGCRARCFGKAFWVSWEALGSSLAGFEPSGPTLGVS